MNTLPATVQELIKNNPEMEEELLVAFHSGIQYQAEQPLAADLITMDNVASHLDHLWDCNMLDGITEDQMDELVQFTDEQYETARDATDMSMSDNLADALQEEADSIMHVIALRIAKAHGADIIITEDEQE